MAMPTASRRAVALAALFAVIAVVYYTWHGRARTTSTTTAPERTRPARISSTPSNTARHALGLTRVRGTVRDVVTHEGVAGVRVIFARQPGEATSAVSEPGGSYELMLMPGRHVLRVDNSVARALHQDAVITVASHQGNESQDIDIMVWRLARIEGRVVDGDGEPLAEVEVHYQRRGDDNSGDDNSGDSGDNGDNGDSSAYRPSPKLTDVVGRFALSVPPGEVELFARAADRPESSTTVRNVEPGATLTGVEIVMDAGAGVRGRVIDDTNAPIANAEVIGYTDESRQVRTARTDANGHFAILALAPGRIMLEAQAEGFAPSKLSVVSVEPGAERDALTLVLQSPRAISGRVVDDIGAVVAAAQVRAQPSVGRLNIAHATADEHGVFQLQGLGAGPFVLHADAPDLVQTTLVVVSAPREDVQLTMLRAGSLSGQITDKRGRPVTDFWVRVDRSTNVAANPADANPANATAPAVLPALLGKSQRFVSDTGEYVLENLTPGTVDVTFWATGAAPAYTRAVAIPIAGRAYASASLEPGASVRVVVTDAHSDRPVRGARVRLSTGTETPAGFTDALGTLLVRDIAPGRRTLEVSHPGYVDHMASGLEANHGHTGDVRVALERLAFGAGRTIEFAGIGAVLVMDNGALRVRELLPHSPADVAGLLPGDEITHVDGQASRDRSMADNIEDVRGIVSTVVRLGIARGDTLFERDVVRGNVRFKPRDIGAEP